MKTKYLGMIVLVLLIMLFPACKQTTEETTEETTTSNATLEGTWQGECLYSPEGDYDMPSLVIANQTRAYELKISPAAGCATADLNATMIYLANQMTETGSITLSDGKAVEGYTEVVQSFSITPWNAGTLYYLNTNKICDKIDWVEGTPGDILGCAFFNGR